MTKLIMVDERAAPGRSPVGLAWDGELLWNADYAAGRLYGIDLVNDRVVDSLLCPGVLSGLAWDGSALWQSILDEGWLRKINPKTHDYDRTIVIGDHGRLAGVTWDGQNLWAVSQQRGLLIKIDAGSDEVTREIQIPVAAGGLAYRDDTLWVSYPAQMTFTGTEFQWLGTERRFFVAQIDIASGQERTRYELDFLPLGLAWATDSLWISSVAQGKLYRAQIS